MTLRQIHFIVGMPRAGTTYLVRRLQEHPDIMAIGESQFFGNRWIDPGEKGYDAEQLAQVHALMRANPLDSSIPLPEDPVDQPGWVKHLTRADLSRLADDTIKSVLAPIEPGELFRAWAEHLAAGTDAKVLVEKTPHHARNVDRILAQLPDARVLILIRDPYDFLLSYKNTYRIKEDADNRQAHRRRWHALGVALIWRSYLRHALASHARYPEQTLLLRLEEINAEPQIQLSRIQEFLGVEIHDIWSDGQRKVNSSFSDGRPKLTRGEIAVSNWIARNDFQEASYTLRPSNAAALEVIHQMVTLVPWVFWNLLDAKSRTSGSIVNLAKNALLKARD